MNLQRRQELCLDAIEHSFRMATIAYDRITEYCRLEHDAGNSLVHDALVLDAWSFVDVAKRLRSVLEHTPGVKNAASLASFLHSTEGVVGFRHHVQHMEEKTAGVAESGRPIWGAFSWAVQDPDQVHFRVGLYIPGRIAKATGIPMVNPAKMKFRAPVDHFQVCVGDTTLKISDMHFELQDFEGRFKAALSTASSRQVSAGETILIIDLDE